MYIGKTVRTIRLNKNIKSNIAYKDILSRSVAINFEKGLADTTVNKFFKIIDNLHVTLEEFESFHLNQENKHAYYTNGYIDAFYHKNITELTQLIDQSSHDYKVTSNEKYNHYYAIMSLLLAELQNSTDYENHVFILQNYLINCNTWGYYEITLFTNTVQYYSDELIDIVYSQVTKALQHSPRKRRYQDDIAALLCNILEIKILTKNIQSATFYLNELKDNISTSPDNTYSKIMLKFFTSIIEYIQDNDKEENIIRTIDTLAFLELQIIKEICESTYYRVKALYLE